MAKSISPKRPRKEKGRAPRGLVPMTGGDFNTIEEMARSFAQRDDSPLEARTQAQADYIQAIYNSQLTFGIGPAGTGKSYIAASIAAQLLADREIDRIIITRPVVEAGEELGFLPGEMEDKVRPYFAPIREILERKLGRSPVEMFTKNERVVFMPLAYMRGHTLDRCMVILDEAQNTTPAQMKLLLTRLGENTIAVVDGDPLQRDIDGPSGLIDGMEKARGLPGVSVVRFTHADVVRSGLVRSLLLRYENPVAESDRAGLERVLGVA